MIRIKHNYIKHVVKNSFFPVIRPHVGCARYSSGPPASSLQSRPCNRQLVPAFLIPSSPMGEISHLLAHGQQQNASLLQGKTEYTQQNLIVAEMGHEPQLIDGILKDHCTKHDLRNKDHLKIRGYKERQRYVGVHISWV